MADISFASHRYDKSKPVIYTVGISVGDRTGIGTRFIGRKNPPSAFLKGRAKHIINKLNNLQYRTLSNFFGQ